MYIPFHSVSIGDEEIQEVVDTLRSGWLTTGPKAARFEEEFRAYVGSRCSLAVNSGTAGLHLALAALGIGPGDEVITTPMTFCATINVIMQTGATPVLADIGPDGNIDPASVAERITGRTRCLLPVHLGGLPCAMDALWDLARRHNLFVVEDAAHAVGSRYNGSMIGAVDARTGAASDAVVFSFYATKNLTTGEGGMVTTQNEVLAERMRILCLHGITRDAWGRYARNGSWAYDVVECGFKYNLSDIQAALGIHQLRKLEAHQEIRTRYAAIYHEAFAGVEEVECAPDHEDCGHSWHLYALRLNLDQLAIDRAEFIERLRARGIGASVHFIPIPLHPLYEPLARLERNHCPRALELYPRLVSLPLYPAMTEEDIHRVAEEVINIIKSTTQSR